MSFVDNDSQILPSQFYNALRSWACEIFNYAYYHTTMPVVRLYLLLTRRFVADLLRTLLGSIRIGARTRITSRE